MIKSLLKKPKKRKLVYVVIGVVLLFLSLVGFEYLQYTNLSRLDLRSAIFRPTEGDDQEGNTTKYFKLDFYHPQDKDNPDNIEVIISPTFEYKVYVASDQELVLRLIGQAKYDEVKRQLGTDADKVLHDVFLLDQKHFIIERTGPPLKVGTVYRFTFRLKTWNLFAMLFKTDSMVRDVLMVDRSTYTDDDTRLKNSFFDGVKYYQEALHRPPSPTGTPITEKEHPLVKILPTTIDGAYTDFYWKKNGQEVIQVELRDESTYSEKKQKIRQYLKDHGFNPDNYMYEWVDVHGIPIKNLN